MRLVQSHILLESADEQMRMLFSLKLRRESEGKIGRGRKASFDLAVAKGMPRAGHPHIGGALCAVVAEYSLHH